MGASASTTNISPIMSQTEPTVVTENYTEATATNKTTDIRKAFKHQASFLEDGNRQLTATFNNRLPNVNGTLSGRIGELSHEVQQLKSEVSQVKNRLDQMEGGVGEMKTRLNQIEGRSFNKSRILPRHTLSSIRSSSLMSALRSLVIFRLPLMAFRSCNF